MNLANKKIGVWGFGISGRATVAFLHQQKVRVQVIDQKPLTPHDQKLLANQGIHVMPSHKLDHFLQSNDYIIASPGIDLRSHQSIQHKLIAELDLFAEHFTKPIIAITGTIGKTTITTLLSQLLTQQNLHIATGGNIGVGLCDLLSNNQVDYAVLEVSSFQLEHCKTFAPDLAIITNFHPNHLDRHGTLANYWQAKLNIMRYQQEHQKALVPLALANQLPANIKSTVAFFSPNKPTDKQKELLNDHAIFWLHEQQIIKTFKSTNTPIYTIATINQMFTENILCIIAALSLLNQPIGQFAITPIEHRMEHVATINGIAFYNDSKATVPEATLAAVNKLHNQSIHLFLGGLSKGVDRAPFIASLKNKVSRVYCFGAEASELFELCNQHNILAKHFKTLDEAFNACVANMQNKEIVLFSPSGASFDLFANYQQRGEHFKRLIDYLKQT